MDLNSILETGIEAGNSIYTPAIIPVDYGGSFVYSLSIHLTDGRFLSRSSFELDDAGDESRRCARTLALLRESVSRSGLRPRCDYLNAPLTKAYRARRGVPPPVRAVSACLCGECCRYDGGAHPIPALARLAASGEVLPVCPEVSGGLAAPRPPCELSRGRAVDAGGGDYTAAFAAGARRALRDMRTLGVTRALLKEKSPSCGVRFIYDGAFTRTLIPGQGLFAALLDESGIETQSEALL